MLIHIILYLLAGIAILLIFTTLYEWCCRFLLDKKALRDKTFITLSGKRLHYVQKGTGNQSILFLSGLGGNHFIWRELQQTLKSEAVTLSYDRNGLLFSEDAGTPITNPDVSRELENLLKALNCPKPYILVVHSMAGIYMRPFIQKHASDIKGIVFVESAHPDQIDKMSPRLLKKLLPPPHFLIKLLVRTGIYRIVFSFMPLLPEIPIKHPLQKRERRYFYRSCDKILEELKHDNENLHDAKKYGDFGSIPLITVNGTSEIRYALLKDAALKKEYKELVTTLQQDFLSLSTNSSSVEAPNSGHIIQIRDKEILLRQIRKLLHL